MLHARCSLRNARADAMQLALETSDLKPAFDRRAVALLWYADKLTRNPAAIVEADVHALRAAGLDDGEILETNQVISYFAYANPIAGGSEPAIICERNASSRTMLSQTCTCEPRSTRHTPRVERTLPPSALPPLPIRSFSDEYRLSIGRRRHGFPLR